jgi:penicillin amidase
MSMRWAVLDGQGEIETLSRIGRARSVEEWLAAMESWRAPIQNGLVADRSGHIAIRAQGFYPERPENTTGAWFYDGTTSAADWTGRLPSVPTAVDPEQGFLASANQQPVDPEVDDTFLGADWPTPWRALTINRLLQSKQRHTADDLASYHTYPSSARAEHFVPAFLAAAEAVRSAGDGGGALSEAVALLVSWDLRYDRDNTGPVLFERAMTEVTGRVYDELEDAEGRRVATPSDAITWVLLGQPRSPWWDDRSTEPVETRDAILAESLAASYRDLREALGPVGPAWRWREHRTARIRHLLGIPALSRTDLAIQGGPGLLNPSAGSGAFGASWRMVVELGDEVRARGTYPGGQSGNPLSTGYADRLEIWVEGDLSDLRFPAPEGSLDSAGLTRSRLTLSPGGRP